MYKWRKILNISKKFLVVLAAKKSKSQDGRHATAQHKTGFIILKRLWLHNYNKSLSIIEISNRAKNHNLLSIHSIQF